MERTPRAFRAGRHPREQRRHQSGARRPIDFSEKDWDDVLALNTKTVFFFSQAVARDMMKRKRGKIINVASLLSFQGGILVPSYAASKGAVAQITKALANEWAKSGINITPSRRGTWRPTTRRHSGGPGPFRRDPRPDPRGALGLPDDLKGVRSSLPPGRRTTSTDTSWSWTAVGWLARIIKG